MKQLFGSWLSTIFFLTMSASALANSFTFNGYSYSVNEDGTSVTVMGGQGSDGSVIIPDYAYDENGDSYAVTVVGQGAFKSFSGNKVVIGDNVTTIEGKAFEHFAENKSDCVLILGKSITSMPTKAFEHFGEHGTNNTVVVKCDEVPIIDKQTFEHVKNTTFIVRDDDTYSDFKSANVWSSYDTSNNTKNIKYSWPFPFEFVASGGKWLTAVFPVDMSETEIINYFGHGTKVAYLESANFDSGKNEYQLHFEYTESIEANSPYLIKVGNEDVDFVSEVSGNPSVSTLTRMVPISNKSGFQAQTVGVFSHYTLSENEFYLRNLDGSLYFYFASDDGCSYVNANKCYFKILDDKGIVTGAKVGSVFDLGEVTAAGAIEAQKRRGEGVYSIYGQYIGDSTANLPNGIYIVNGKKVVNR